MILRHRSIFLILMAASHCAALGDSQKPTATPAKEARACRDEVDRLTTENVALLKRVVDLTARLDSLTADQRKSADLQPILDALAALKAVDSVVTGGGAYPDFKQYYLAASVKVNALPSSTPATSLRHILAMYSDANTLLNATVVRSGSAASTRSFFDSMCTKYPGFQGAAGDVMGYGDIAVYDFRDGARHIIHLAGSKLQEAEATLRPPQALPTPTPSPSQMPTLTPAPKAVVTAPVIIVPKDETEAEAKARATVEEDIKRIRSFTIDGPQKK